ncbi:hypothetical protein DCAR_0101112 [Daucus carota subsp. sativus]|uniref:Uncharacterized protein n=1 Tax=Daucus carota subsp. sativus TaxID=79200 RepID=A0A162B0T7_DAUCS|nr:hypothetical protein DCAR_0101112 [Daucus carota subsp. sativus]
MSWYLIINEDVNIQPLNQNLNPLHEATLNSFALESQVFEVQHEQKKGRWKFLHP